MQATIETDTPRPWSPSAGWFALAFGLALLLRLLRLGELPLGDDEARWAVQALDLARGVTPELGPQPAYIMLTTLLFFVFHPSDFAARLAPALFGAALVWVPFLFHDRLGKKAALVLAFFLAFEPGLLALARTAGSPIIAVSAALLAWGLWRNGYTRAAGIFAGFALLGGPLLWPGLIGLGVAYGLVGRMTPREDEEIQPLRNRSTLFTALGFAVGTYVLAGSLFLRVPGGLGAGLASIPAYFGGWLDFTDVYVTRLLITLGSYQLFALLFALVALVRGYLTRDELSLKLGAWLLAALVLAFANPFRQVSDLAWALLPLWALAAREVARYLEPIEDGVWETIAMTVFTAVIIAFAAMNFTSLALAPADLATQQLRWLVMIGSLLLLAVSMVLVAYGWSIPVATQGGVWGLVAVLAIYTFANSMAAGGLRTYRTVELWSTGMGVKQARALDDMLNELSLGKLGTPDAIDVAVAGVDSPALRWTLRNRSATFSNGLTVFGTPSVLITPVDYVSPDLEAGYRGKDVTWRTAPAWNQGLSTDWMRWLVLHDFPQGEEKVKLWVRSDIFIDTQNINP